MKKTICYFILLLFIISVVPVKADQYLDLSKYTLVAENEYLRLYIDQKTTQFAVYSKEEDKIWYSNPQNLSQMEKLAHGNARDKMNSQLEIDYYITGGKRLTMDNYNDSIKYNQYTIKPLQNGVKITYLLGKEWLEEDYLPIMVTKERFDKLILGRLNSKDQEFLLKRYELISVEKNKDIKNKDAERLFGTEYNLISHSLREEGLSDDFLEFSPKRLDSVELLETLIDQYINNRLDVEKSSDVKSAYVEQLKDNPTYILRKDVPAWDKPYLIDIFKQIGYTPQEVQKDHKVNNLDPPRPNTEVFRIPIEYILQEDSLVVKIPVGEIKYPQDIIDENGNKTTFPLHTIEVLNYFAAADNEQQGYIFVPDGSGALIYLNNNKTYAPPYTRPLYGEDFSAILKEEQLQTFQKNYLPVYGLKEGDKAFLAIIEEGDALASIKADIAGRTNSYNTISAKFNVIPKGTVTIQMDEDKKDGTGRDRLVNIYQSRIYQGDIQIRFYFLSDQKADYTGMALCYQRYLQGKGLKKISPNADIPFYLELIGAIDKKEPVRGAARQIVKPLTTYRQAVKIIDELLNRNIFNIKLRYSGILSGGLEHEFPSSFQLEEVLGEEDEWQELIKFLSKKGITLYPDVSFLNVYKNSLTDEFFVYKDAAHFLDYAVAKIYDYNLATYQYQPADFVTVLSPARLDKIMANFLKEYRQNNFAGISLRDMGRQLNSDFRKNPKDLVDRQQALEIIKEQLQKIKTDKLEIMLNGGNGYVLPYIDHLLNTSFYSNRFNLFDKEVPFLQLVLHGYVNFTGPALNMEQNYKKILLKSLETGASPYFLLTYEDSSLMKESRFSNLFATYYQNWLEEAEEIYQILNMVLKELQDKRIVRHREVAENVYETLFETGQAIVVNYGSKAVTVHGVTVEAEGYKILQEGSIR